MVFFILIVNISCLNVFDLTFDSVLILFIANRPVFRILPVIGVLGHWADTAFFRAIVSCEFLFFIIVCLGHSKRLSKVPTVLFIKGELSLALLQRGFWFYFWVKIMLYKNWLLPSISDGLVDSCLVNFLKSSHSFGVIDCTLTLSWFVSMLSSSS